MAAGLLEVRNLGLNFGGLCALSGFDLSLTEGDLLGIIGPNGAGKTTLFNLIAGIYRPSAGEIHFAGKRMNGLAPHEIARQGIGRTFQNIRLFRSMSVMDNVRTAVYQHMSYTLWGGTVRSEAFCREEEMAQAKAEELLKEFGLWNVRAENAGNLPYGFQRRLEIARALATKPRLLLLDEPAAGMNPAEVDELMHLIVETKRMFGLTILIIEHQMRLIMGICRKIVVLDFGVVIAQGTPQEIQANPQVIEAYLGEEPE